MSNLLVTTSTSNPKKVHLDLTSKDYDCFIDGKWINENIIIEYLKLIKTRSSNNPNLPTVSFFGTSFIVDILNCHDPRLIRYLAMETKMNIFDYEIVLIPFIVNANHWTLICVDFAKKTIVHYDSYYRNLSNFALYGEAVLNYIYLEAVRHHKIDMLLKFENWKVLQEKRWPQQRSANDSGIFLCLYAETLSIRAPPLFTTQDMNLHRVKIMIELLEVQLKERHYDRSYFVNDAEHILEHGSQMLGWMPELVKSILMSRVVQSI